MKDCKSNQMRLCYEASHNAAKEMLINYIVELDKKRAELVKVWRDGGMNQDDWKAVEDLDAVINKQEQILMDMQRTS